MTDINKFMENNPKEGEEDSAARLKNIYTGTALETIGDKINWETLKQDPTSSKDNIRKYAEDASKALKPKILSNKIPNHLKAVTLGLVTLASGPSFEAQTYNAASLPEQKIWDKNFKAGKESYSKGTLNKKQQYNATQFNAVLSKSKDSFKDDLKYLNIDYDDFVEKMMGVYSAETSFGLNEKKISKTGARGELQVTLETLKDIIKPKGNFGPKMAKAAGVDLKKLRAMSDKELNNLLLNDNRFNYLIGSAVMLNKLQYRTKK